MSLNKKLNTIARFFFVFFFFVSSISLVSWELWSLSEIRGEKKYLVLPEFRSNDSSSVSVEAVGLREGSEGKIESELEAEDARPLIIKRYLEKYKSPLAPYSDLIFELSEDYGFEYYWIVAIAQQESNLCKKIPEGSHNCWGYGIHKRGTLGFDNYEIALRSYAEYLKREYFDKGLNTTELIMGKYCPSSNGSWAFGVNQFIREMETGDF